MSPLSYSSPAQQLNNHMPPVSNSSHRKNHNSFFLSFLYIFLAYLFRIFRNAALSPPKPWKPTLPNLADLTRQDLDHMFPFYHSLDLDEECSDCSHPNTRSEHKGTNPNEKDFAKLKDSADNSTDSIPKDARLGEEEYIFERWCYIYNKTYSNKAEKNIRFGLFKQNLLPPGDKTLCKYPNYADLTLEELKAIFSPCPLPDDCYVPRNIDDDNRLKGAAFFRDEHWDLQGLSHACNKVIKESCKIVNWSRN